MNNLQQVFCAITGYALDVTKSGARDSYYYEHCHTIAEKGHQIDLYAKEVMQIYLTVKEVYKIYSAINDYNYAMSADDVAVTLHQDNAYLSLEK